MRQTQPLLLHQRHHFVPIPFITMNSKINSEHSTKQKWLNYEILRESECLLTKKARLRLRDTKNSPNALKESSQY